MSGFSLKYKLGLIPGTAKIDAKWNKLLGMRDELQELEQSDELARYRELDAELKSAEFRARKKELTQLKFEGSHEQKILSELEHLSRSKSMKQYFKTLSSEKLARFKKIEKGDKLARFNELKEIVTTPEFTKRRKDVEKLHYNNSPEAAKRKEFEALKNDKRLKSYYNTLASDSYRLYMKAEESGEKPSDPNEIKRYEKFLASGEYSNLKTVEKQNLTQRYEELRGEVQSDEFLEREKFLKNSKRYQTTDDYRLLAEYEKLSKDPEIKFYHKLSKSGEYLNYQRVHDSKELERLNELEDLVKDEGFRERVAFLKDKKRYEKSEDFKLEQELAKLKNSELIKKYFALHKARELNFFDKWQVAFDDEFTRDGVNFERWNSGIYPGKEVFGNNYSQANELQCLNGEENLQVHGGILSIVTRKEESKGMRWNPQYGLIPAEFQYTSSMLNTGNSFRIKQGIIEAKIRVNPCAEIVSAFSLKGDGAFPQIDILRSGKNEVSMGVIREIKGEPVWQHQTITGLNFKKFHVYRLEWDGQTLTWKINNAVVHQSKVDSSFDNMFLNLLSSVHEEVHHQNLPHYFEVDWVRCLVPQAGNN